MYGNSRSKKIWQCREAAGGLFTEGAQAVCFNTEEYPCLNYCSQVVRDGFKHTWIKETTNNLTNLALTDRKYRHLLPSYTHGWQQKYADPQTWQSASGETHQPGINHRAPGPLPPGTENHLGAFPSYGVDGNSYHKNPIQLTGFQDSSQRTVDGRPIMDRVYARDPSRTTSYGKTETGYIDALKMEDGSTGFDGKKEAILYSPHDQNNHARGTYNYDNHGNVLRRDVDQNTKMLSGASAGADEKKIDYVNEYVKDGEYYHIN